MIVGRLQTGLQCLAVPRGPSHRTSHYKAACFLRVSGERGSEGKKAGESPQNGSQTLYNLVSEVLSHHLPYSSNEKQATSPADTEGARMTEGHGKWEAGIIGGHFRGCLRKSC